MLIVGHRVASGLAQHRLVAGEVPVGAHLGGDVARRVHAHVDVLPAPGDVACQHRGERAHHRPRAADVERLVAAAAHRGERVVVVAAAPRRATAGEQGEVGGGLVRARALAPERRDRDPDQPLVVGAQLGVVESERGQTAGRLALEHDVGVGHQTAELLDARPAVARSSTTPRFDVL